MHFFVMDERGYPVSDSYGKILDFYVSMEDDDYEYLLQN